MEHEKTIEKENAVCESDLVVLFETTEEDTKSSERIAVTRYYIDQKSGIAYMRLFYFNFHYSSASPSMSCYEHKISYEELLEEAARHNKSLYQKLLGIDETNWKEYVAKLQL